MDESSTMKVQKRSRAGNNGKLIVCPKCNESARVFHFSWSALTCQSCQQSINKYEWDLVG